MTLYIDTTDFNKVTYAVSSPLSKEGVRGGYKIKKRTYKIDPHNSHKTLAKFESFLKQFKIRNPESAIKEILVNKGPGSYTGVRVGLAHAMALGFAWNARVKALPKDKFIIK